MENTEQTYQQPVAENELKIEGLAEMNLQGAAKWAKIVSIIGLSLMALIFLMMIVVSFSMPGGLGIIVLLLYAVILGIGALPYFFMYKFATQIQTALASKRTGLLSEGFGSLKNSFLILGVLMIIAIVFYLVAFVIIMATGASFLSALGGF